MNKVCSISIIILTQNSMGVITRLVDRLLPQLSYQHHELVFLDSNSTDGTLQYILDLPFPNKRILPVKDGTFSHSRTRMWGAENCQSDLVVFFTDDIIPFSDNFLAELVAPVSKGDASASYGVSLIDPEKGDPLRAHRYNNWYLNQPELVDPISETGWNLLTPAERRKSCNFDDCAACYDRSVLQEIRFPDLPYGEDIGIAKRLITGNHSIALAKKAQFHHWHDVSYSYLVKRMCIDQIVIKDLFGLLYFNNMASLAWIIFLQSGLYFFLAFTLPSIKFSKRFHWLIYSIRYIWADNIGKYIGGLDERAIHPWNLTDSSLLRVKNRYYEEVIKYSLKRA